LPPHKEGEAERRPTPRLSTAIAAAEADVSSGRIATWLSVHASRRSFAEEDDWVRKASGAKILEELFTDFSGATLEYRKVEHSVALTKWLIANKPAMLEELFDYVRGLFAKEKTNG
jgi:hypothetical protein